MVWDASSVYMILMNEAYTGMLVQGKTQSLVLGKGISRRAPEEMRWKHPNKHDAIVSDEEFRQAQSVIKFVESRGEGQTRDYLLKGVVRCQNCGRTMSWNNGTFRCHRSVQGDFSGCGGSWKEEEIEKAVLAALIERGKKAAWLLGRLGRSEYDVVAAKDEIEALKNARMEKYEAYIQGMVSRDEYKAFQDEVREKIAALQNGIAVTKGEDARLEEVEERLKPLADGSVAALKNGLTREMVLELVENVWVGEEIEAEFKADSTMKAVEDDLVG